MHKMGIPEDQFKKYQEHRAEMEKEYPGMMSAEETCEPVDLNAATSFLDKNKSENFQRASENILERFGLD